MLKLGFTGSYTQNRGQEHHCWTSFKVAEDGLPMRFGSVQRGGGTLKDSHSSTDQRWLACV